MSIGCRDDLGPPRPLAITWVFTKGLGGPAASLIGWYSQQANM